MESVLGQNYPYIEYIVIDGGSTDGTIDIMKEYEPLFGNRLQWLSETDMGFYDALNKGFQLAKGDVVGILNADDVFHDNCVIDKIAKEFNSGHLCCSVDVLYGDIRFVKDCCADDTCEQVRRAKTFRYYSGKLWKPWMASWGFMPPHPSIYIRKSLFDLLGGYNLKYQISADFEFMIRYLRKAKLNLLYIPLCVVDMRMGGKSTSGIRSTILLNKENVLANRANGYFSIFLMMIPKYLYKIWGFLLFPGSLKLDKH
jgi:glycosyltransferase involved in cell wall biosynthesis